MILYYLYIVYKYSFPNTIYIHKIVKHIIRAMKIRTLLWLWRKLLQKFAKIETLHFGFLGLKIFALQVFGSKKLRTLGFWV